MKRTTGFIALALAAILAGCEEYPVTDLPDGPQQGANLNRSYADMVARDGRIEIDAIIPVTAAFSQMSARVIGTASYELGPSPVLVQDLLQLKLRFRANLTSTDGTGPVYSFSGESSENLSLNAPTLDPVSGPSVLHEKDYVIETGDLTVVLSVGYRVSRESVSIEAIGCSMIAH